ncbi:MAG: glutamate racemase [Gemmatimonadota bacterium]|nr:glutamate racemase [Gemmatimonadota bacterium]
MSADPSAPIGVFDSGIGGLTVVRELMRQLPDEDIIYFGDTARVPYGPKSPETVTRYAHEITTFLRDQGVKTVVVACNTATAHAMESLREHFDIPITGVIEPGARAAVRASASRRIGVLGTNGTITSGAYERAIHAFGEDVFVTARACPLFVPFVEEGWTEHPAIELVAHDYLASLRDTAIDALVLGCTHYPLIKPVIARAVGPHIRLIDSAEETAAEVASLLTERGMRRAAGSTPAQYRFIASDVPEQFRNLGKRFLGSAIDRVETVTLG